MAIFPNCPCGATEHKEADCPHGGVIGCFIGKERLGTIQPELGDEVAGLATMPGPGGEQAKSDKEIQRMIDRVATSECSNCKHTVLMLWQYCPGCGGELVWATLKQEGGTTIAGI